VERAGIGSGSCLVTGLGIGGIVTLGSVARGLVTS
jgi:hypothetical protein